MAAIVIPDIGIRCISAALSWFREIGGTTLRGRTPMSEAVGVERTTIGSAMSTGTSTSTNARQLIGVVNVVEAVIAFG
jgi:hypothetical protein